MQKRPFGRNEIVLNPRKDHTVSYEGYSQGGRSVVFARGSHRKEAERLGIKLRATGADRLARRFL
jgi:hypothetical protein